MKKRMRQIVHGKQPPEEEELPVGTPAGMKRGGKVQGRNARLDESLGERRGPERDFEQSMKDRRDESRGSASDSMKSASDSMKAASDKAKRGVGAVAGSRPWANGVG